METTKFSLKPEEKKKRGNWKGKLAAALAGVLGASVVGPAISSIAPESVAAADQVYCFAHALYEYGNDRIDNKTVVRTAKQLEDIIKYIETDASFRNTYGNHVTEILIENSKENIYIDGSTNGNALDCFVLDRQIKIPSGVKIKLVSKNGAKIVRADDLNMKGAMFRVEDGGNITFGDNITLSGNVSGMSGNIDAVDPVPGADAVYGWVCDDDSEAIVGRQKKNPDGSLKFKDDPSLANDGTYAHTANSRILNSEGKALAIVPGEGRTYTGSQTGHTLYEAIWVGPNHWAYNTDHSKWSVKTSTHPYKSHYKYGRPYVTYLQNANSFTLVFSASSTGFDNKIEEFWGIDDANDKAVTWDTENFDPKIYGASSWGAHVFVRDGKMRGSYSSYSVDFADDRNPGNNDKHLITLGGGLTKPQVPDLYTDSRCENLTTPTYEVVDEGQQAQPGNPEGKKYANATAHTWSKDEINNNVGFFVRQWGGTVKIDGATLRDYDTAAYGTAPTGTAPVYVSAGTFTFADGMITENDVNGDNSAGAVYTTGGTVNITGGEIRKNTAAYASDVFTSDYSKSEAQVIKDRLKDNSLNRNSAGAIIFGGGTGHTITGGFIGENKGESGAIIVRTDGNESQAKTTKVTMTGGVIAANTGVHYAGAVYINPTHANDTAEFIMADENDGDSIYPAIVDNFTWNKGGAVYVSSEVFNVQKKRENAKAKFGMHGGVIDNNTAIQRGGAINVISDDVILEKGQITNNNSRVLGGAIYVEGDYADRTYTLYIPKGYIGDNHAYQETKSGVDKNNPDPKDYAYLKRILNDNPNNDTYVYGSTTYTYKSPLGAARDSSGNVVESNKADWSKGKYASGGYRTHDWRDFGRWGSAGQGGGLWLCALGGYASIQYLNGNYDDSVIVNNNEAEKEGDDITALANKGGFVLLNDAKNGQASEFKYEGSDEALIWGKLYSGGSAHNVYNSKDSSVNDNTDRGKDGIYIKDNNARNGGGIASNGTVIFGKGGELYDHSADVEIQKQWEDGLNVGGHEPVGFQGYLTYTDSAGNEYKKAIPGYQFILDGYAENNDDQALMVYEKEPYKAKIALPYGDSHFTYTDANGNSHTVSVPAYVLTYGNNKTASSLDPIWSELASVSSGTKAKVKWNFTIEETPTGNYGITGLTNGNYILLKKADAGTDRDFNFTESDGSYSVPKKLGDLGITAINGLSENDYYFMKTVSASSGTINLVNYLNGTYYLLNSNKAAVTGHTDPIVLDFTEAKYVVDDKNLLPTDVTITNTYTEKKFTDRTGTNTIATLKKYNTGISGLKTGTLKNKKPEEFTVEKYVNKKVDETLPGFDSVFTYDILAYVPESAKTVEISDTLVEWLEFVDIDGNAQSSDKFNASKLVVNGASRPAELNDIPDNYGYKYYIYRKGNEKPSANNVAFADAEVKDSSNSIGFEDGGSYSRVTISDNDKFGMSNNKLNVDLSKLPAGEYVVVRCTGTGGGTNVYKEEVVKSFTIADASNHMFRVVYDSSAEDGNNHIGTGDGTGTVSKTNVFVKDLDTSIVNIDNKVISASIPVTADMEGKWIQLTFNARIKPEHYSDVENKIITEKAVQDLTPNRANVTYTTTGDYEIEGFASYNPDNGYYYRLYSLEYFDAWTSDRSGVTCRKSEITSGRLTDEILDKFGIENKYVYRTGRLPGPTSNEDGTGWAVGFNRNSGKFSNLPAGKYFLACWTGEHDDSRNSNYILDRCRVFEVGYENINWVEVGEGVTVEPFKTDIPVTGTNNAFHDGIGNRASYEVKYRGGITKSKKTNTVTVEPPTKALQFTKKWEGDGAAAPTNQTIINAFKNALSLKLGNETITDPGFTIERNGNEWTIRTKELPEFVYQNYTLSENLLYLKTSDTLNNNVKDFFKYYNVSYSNTATQSPNGLAAQIEKQLKDEYGNTKLHDNTIVIGKGVDRKILSVSDNLGGGDGHPGGGCRKANPADVTVVDTKLRTDYAQKGGLYVNDKYWGYNYTSDTGFGSTPKTVDVSLDLDSLHEGMYFDADFESADGKVKIYHIASSPDKATYSIYKEGYEGKDGKTLGSEMGADYKGGYPNGFVYNTKEFGGIDVAAGERDYGLYKEGVSVNDLTTAITSAGDYVIVSKNNAERVVRLSLRDEYTDGNLVDGGTIYNTKKLHKVVIRKTDKNGHDRSGAKFELRRNNASGSEIFMGINGAYHTSGDVLEPGTYYIKETNPPKGYYNKDNQGNDVTIEFTFKVNNDGSISDISNTFNGKVSIDSDNSFVINVQNDTITTEIEIVKKWDDNGVVRERPDSITITIESDEYGEAGQFSDYKQHTINKPSLDSDTWTDTITGLPKYIYDDNGEVDRAINYRIREENVSGFINTSTQMVSGSVTNVTSSTVDNTTYYASSKYDASNGGYIGSQVHYLETSRGSGITRPAFCINYPVQGPNVYSNQYYYNPIEYKKILVQNGTDLQNYIVNNNYITSGSIRLGNEDTATLYKRLIAISLWGYGSGTETSKNFKNEFGISDEEFIWITQCAVFEYSDWYGDYNNKNFREKKQRVFALDARNDAARPNKGRLHEAYRAFISRIHDANLDEVAKDKHLYLYIPQSTNNLYKYQNLIGVGDNQYEVTRSKVTITNEPLADLTIQKVDESGDPMSINKVSDDKYAEFKLVQASDAENAKRAAETSGYPSVWVEGAKYKFEGVTAGTYWLVETKAPKYYTIGEPVKVIVSGGDSTGDLDSDDNSDDENQNGQNTDGTEDKTYSALVHTQGKRNVALTGYEVSEYDTFKNAEDGNEVWTVNEHSELTYTDSEGYTRILVIGKTMYDKYPMHNAHAAKAEWDEGGYKYQDYYEDTAHSSAYSHKSILGEKASWQYSNGKLLLNRYNDTIYMSGMEYVINTMTGYDDGYQVDPYDLGHTTLQGTLDASEAANVIIQTWSSDENKWVPVNVLTDGMQCRILLEKGTGLVPTTSGGSSNTGGGSNTGNSSNSKTQLSVQLDSEAVASGRVRKVSFNRYGFHFSYKNEPIAVELPNTGGSGTLWIFLIGAGAVAAAITGLAVRSRRKKNIDDNVA